MTLFVNVGSFWCFKQYHSSWFQIPSSVYPPPPSPPPPSLHPYYATAYGCGVQGAQRYVYILFLRIYVYISNSFVMLDVFVVCSPMLMRYCTKEMTTITIIIIYIIFVHFVIHSVCSFFIFFFNLVSTSLTEWPMICILLLPRAIKREQYSNICFWCLCIHVWFYIHVWTVFVDLT